MAFTYWRDGEPNGGGDATEGCVEMYSYSAGTDWNDNQCNNTIQFICEKQSTEYRYPYLPSPECTFCSLSLLLQLVLNQDFKTSAYFQ